MSKTVIKNGNFENGLKRFKQQVAKSKTLSEVRKREHFVKPGDKRREAEKAARINSRKQNRRNEND